MAYLDHAATTPMRPEALAAHAEAARTVGNASSLHAPGRAARRRVEEAREQVAAALGARPSEVVFTAGGTESDNLAVKGIFWGRRTEDPRRRLIIASAVEHHAVLDAVQWLARIDDAEVVWLDTDPTGMIRPDSLAAALAAAGPAAGLVTAMWANNEVGTIQPVAALAALAAAHGVPMHTDAVQAVGQIPVDFGAAGVPALTVSGHKLGGPVGVGALLLARDVPCTPLLHGGGQERDVRSGTLDVAGIAAFAAAVAAATAAREREAKEVAELRDALIAGVRAAVPDAVLNGHPELRLPGNAHFGFPGCEGDALLLLLDAQGIACSTGSACSAGVAQPSHVLLALGADEALARSSLRFTLGHTSTTADVAALLAALPAAVERARAAGALRSRR
ncbi:cysteine desulfurase [Pilimelia anulata]|uniref:Cysteine desulfurase n=1 Tax=Pilimelia anulata TaxID=53371 RepID=A0A8J3B0N4_9ACTN|nr:cysteine desulfurase family protein [Pilimelia anulata]GGJ83782.1 cysteine desulfurase [Pilimelia anulata]